MKIFLRATLAIWGEVTPGPWGDLDQMRLVMGRYLDVITCAIFRDCRLRGVGVVRGVSLPSPIDLTRRPYNTLVTLPCDRVIGMYQTDRQTDGRTDSAASQDVHTAR